MIWVELPWFSISIQVTSAEVFQLHLPAWCVVLSQDDAIVSGSMTRAHQTILFSPSGVCLWIRIILDWQVQVRSLYCNISISPYQDIGLSWRERCAEHTSWSDKREKVQKNWRISQQQKLKWLYRRCKRDTFPSGVTIFKKNEAWAAITEAVNVVSPEARTVAQVQNWFDIKVDAKKTIADKKINILYFCLWPAFLSNKYTDWIKHLNIRSGD